MSEEVVAGANDPAGIVSGTLNAKKVTDDEELAQLRSDIHLAMASPDPAPMAFSALYSEEPIGGHLSPRSQLEWIHWLQNHHEDVFKATICTGPKAIKAPSVKDARVYAAEAFGGRFYAAWSDFTGMFMGWLRIEVTHMGKSSMTFALGEVGGKPVFSDMSDHRARKAPLSAWVKALKELDWAAVV
jgi:hypothetical protein